MYKDKVILFNNNKPQKFSLQSMDIQTTKLETCDIIDIINNIISQLKACRGQIDKS